MTQFYFTLIFNFTLFFLDSILVPGLVRFGKRKELAGLKQIEDIWTSSYCTFLKLKDSNIIIGFGLNNCFQLGIEDMENRYQPDILQALLFEGTLKKVIGGMHHTLFLDSKGKLTLMYTACLFGH